MFKAILLLLSLLSLQARTCVAQEQDTTAGCYKAGQPGNVPCQQQKPDGTTVKQQGVLYVQPFRAPAEFRQWYAETERCMGMRGDYDSVLWLMTAHAWRTVQPWSGKESWTYGLWNTLSDSKLKRAVIVLNSDDWQNPYYVKHEMIHDILWRNGWVNPELGVNPDADSTNVRKSHPVPPYEKCAPTYIEQMWRLRALEQNPFKQVYRP